MKSDVEKLQGLSRRLKIEVPPEIVSAALEKMYQDVQRNAKFKGFRPGKAPITMVKQEYRAKVENDVAAQLIQEHYAKALDQHDLDPVNYPEIELEGLQEGAPLKFTALFEVRPAVELKKYTGLEVEKEKLEVKDDVVDNIINDIRQSKASLVPVIELRPAKMGDIAIIDFEGRIEGKELPGGSGKEYQLDLGAKQFIPGFEEGVAGMNPNETKTIKLKFPEDYHAKDIAGKDVWFTVTLHELKKKVLPELNDEFAKTIGEHTSLQNLKDEIRKDVATREEKRVKDDLKNRVLHALVEANQFEVPKAMIAEQKKVLIDDVHHRMEQQGMPHEQFEEYVQKWDQDFNKSAEFVIRSSLLINEIAKKENLFSSDDDFNQRLETYAKQSGIELEKIRGFYQKQENKSRLRFQMTEEKVMDFLISNAKLKEVTADKLTKTEED
jgi:trigger factor